MNNNDFFDIEEQIENTINNAFKYIDYANNKATDIRNNILYNFNNAAGNVINGVKNKIQDTTNGFNKNFEKSSKKFEDTINSLNRKEKRELNKYIAKSPAGKYKGVVYNTIGVIGCTISLLGAGAVSAISIFTTKFFQFGINLTLGMLSVFFIGSLIIAIKGYLLRKRTDRFNKYSNILKEKNFSEIDKLAECVSKKKKFVIKDLENMMKLKMFNEGHITDDKSYFILSDAVYEEYVNSIMSYNERKRCENEKNDNLDESEKSEITSIIELGDKYISDIERLNYALRGNNICIKIDEMIKIIRNIFGNIKNNPDNIPQVKKFLNHYLPITLKLITSYKDLNEQSIEGENVKKAKIEIEKSIDLINVAFKKLLDDLFEDVVMDVSSDISVLETLFAQEGLTEDDFKKKNS